MSTALKLELAQQAYDNRLPEDVDDSAERQWIENGVDQLMLGADVALNRPGKPAQAVTQERYHIALDELGMSCLSRSGATQSALGKMMHGVHVGDLGLARDGLSEMLGLENPKHAFRDAASELLRPLAHDGVIAEQEDSL